MAITRAQQAKQMLQNGGMLVQPGFGGTRQGYRGPGGYQGGRSDTPAGAAKAGSVERGGGNTNRERAITQQFKGPSGTTGRIDRPDADPKPPQEIIGGKSFDLNPTTKEAQEQKNFAISLENDRRRRAARKRALKERTFLEKLGMLGYTDRTLDDNLVDFGAIDSQFSTIGGVPTGFVGPAIGASTVDPATKSFDIDSIRELASTKTTTGGSLSAKDADTLGDIRGDIQMRDRILDPNDKVTQEEFNEYMNRNKIITSDPDGLDDPCKGPNPPAYCFVGIRSVEKEPEEKIEETFTPNFRLLAGGGMAERAPYEGGIMDLESARQMYGLGKLVKKVTRSVKKIAKSPLGKVAIGAALFKFGSPLFKSEGLKNFFLKDATKKFAFDNLTTKGVLTGIAGISALGGLTAEEDDEEEQYAGADLPFPVDYYLSGQYPPNMRLAAEGGLMRAGYQEGSKEPVAKKTMPLLDMGGMEKDYREEGGFVPIGRMEKADDVPARLSKNEFVFTADAVRNAGDGDVDLGAEKMYNMMKNLEAGGDVSEESQGMDGARKMFQTSQRLEEVI